MSAQAACLNRHLFHPTTTLAGPTHPPIHPPVPLPTAMPRSACASAGESFTPSPTMATACRLLDWSSCSSGSGSVRQCVGVLGGRSGRRDNTAAVFGNISMETCRGTAVPRALQMPPQPPAHLDLIHLASWQHLSRHRSDAKLQQGRGV